MKKTKLGWLLALILGLTATAAVADEEEGKPARSGEEIAKNCVSCHGEKGISQNDMYPHLAGQHADYIVHALKDYKSGQRKDQVMKGMADTLSDSDIEAVAKYFASQDGLITPPLQPAAE